MTALVSLAGIVAGGGACRPTTGGGNTEPSEPAVTQDASQDDDAAVVVERTSSLRRLSRPEYLQTLRDLLGDYDLLEDELPADEISYLVRNVSNGQTLARFDLERYLTVAGSVIDRAWERRTDGAARGVDFRPDGNAYVYAPDFTGTVARIGAVGSATLRLDAHTPGQVLVHVRVRPETRPAGPLTLRVVQDVDTLATIDVAPAYPDGQDLSFVMDPAWRNLPTDWHVPLAFVVDGASEQAPVLVGVSSALVPAVHEEQRLAMCDPAHDTVEACTRRVLVPFVRRAWRRPVTDDEIARLVSLATSRSAAGDAYDDAVKSALTAVLVSPDFLFRVESTDPADGASVNAHEYASRLSYFLWGSMPDAALRAAADSGALLADDEIARQLARMVADRRFDGFARNFAGQWLGFIGAGAAADRSLPGDTAPELLESQFFVTQLVRANEPLASILTSQSTRIESTLSERYGIPIAAPFGWNTVDLSGLARLGYLTQASFLEITSPTAGMVTEPTIRGYFVLSRLLCAEPPPPPMTFDSFATTMPPTGTLRASLEAHRQRAECAGCHEAMDPIGFAFESYGTDGQIRNDVMGYPVDTTGSAPLLGYFTGAMDLIPRIAADPRMPRCVTKQLMTYALGRGNLDPVTDGLNTVRAQAGGDVRMLDLLRAVVTSPQFRARALREGY